MDTAWKCSTFDAEGAVLAAARPAPLTAAATERVPIAAASVLRQHPGEFAAGEGKYGGLPGDRMGHERRALAPEPQEVPGDVLRADDYVERGGSRPEVNIAPRIRSQYLEQAAEIAV